MTDKLEKEKILLEKRKLAHARWWQEDSLVNNRLTWLLTSQTLLFAAYGVVARDGKSVSCTSSATPVKAEALITVLPWLGLLVCIVIVLAIRAAWEAQRILEKQYLTELKIKIGVDDKTNTAGRMPGSLLPLIFGGCWGWLFFNIWGLFLFLVLSLLIPSCVDLWQTEHADKEYMQEIISNKNQLQLKVSNLVGSIHQAWFVGLNRLLKSIIGLFNRTV